MARIRSIKPDFFLDSHMDSVSEAHQKLFQGLWCLADKEGKLGDDHRRIKAQVFPYRDYDCDSMLTDLAEAGFIVRYEVADIPCICIPKFQEHQRPHPKELALGLPHPPEADLAKCREKKRLAVKGFSDIPSSPARKGREGVSFPSVVGKESPKAETEPPPPVPKLSPPTVKRQEVTRYKKPERPRDEWGWGDFEQWGQWRRQEARLPPEQRLPLLLGDEFWTAAMEFTGGEVQPVCDAFIAFGEDPHWQKARPPLPMRAFISKTQWPRFMAQKDSKRAGG